MSTIDDLKKIWADNQSASAASPSYSAAALGKIVKSRAKKHVKAAMRFFWASFTLQVIVYALLSHVIVKYGSDTQSLLISAAGIALFVPFTIMLLRKFKAIAINKPDKTITSTSVYNYLERQYELLNSFYTFKKRYELILVPLSTAIGTFLIFKLYVPGGVWAHLTGAFTTFSIAVVICAIAIVAENRKSFKDPLDRLHELLEEFKLD